MITSYQLEILVGPDLFLVIFVHFSHLKPVKIIKYGLLVAFSHGYQFKLTVGSLEPLKIFKCHQKLLNFISPSGKKLHGTKLVGRVPCMQFQQQQN